MHFKLVLQLTALLGLANTTPILLNYLVGRRWASPLDGGVRLPDGQPLFGSSKTIRGVLSAILATAAGGAALGPGWKIGAAIGAISMAGDLLSSFFKRRLRLMPGGRATGLDQIPEALLPLVVCRESLQLTMLDIAAVTVIFFVVEVLLSIVFYRLHLREQPY